MSDTHLGAARPWERQKEVGEWKPWVVEVWSHVQEPGEGGSGAEGGGGVTGCRSIWPAGDSSKELTGQLCPLSSLGHAWPL